jgi:hypothetical protein
MTATPAPRLHHIAEPFLEKRLIVGSLALECNPDIAESARNLLEVPDTITDCARFTADFRRLFFGEESATES